jgi:glycosyltransferase involved in cell wall biosynthesis
MSPKVSVLMPTYNHERFVSEALDSVLAQEADFSFELVVGDDCSTDRTLSILRDYESRRPGRISLIVAESNSGNGGRSMFRRLLRRARGQYIALLEGDDYWTSPLKLARQVAALEQDPQSFVCFHNAATMYESDRAPHLAHRSDGVPRSASVVDLLLFNFIPTSSVMYRRLDSEDLPDTAAVDLTLHILHALKGSITYLPEAMSVYRVHRTGAWGQYYDPVRREYARDLWPRAKTDVLTRLAPAMDQEIRRIAFEEVAASQIELMELYVAQGRYRLARRAVIEICRYAVKSGVPLDRVAWRFTRWIGLTWRHPKTSYELFAMRMWSHAVEDRLSLFPYPGPGPVLKSAPRPAQRSASAGSIDEALEPNLSGE